MFRIICNNLIYIGHNILFNYYLFLFSIFPSYFKDTIVNAKKTNDIYYNRMMFINFSDDIYNKYNIDIINIHSNIIKLLNNNKINNDNYLDFTDNNIDDENDNISVMSDLSDVSDMSNDENNNNDNFNF
jgi:hypothetical protein